MPIYEYRCTSCHKTIEVLQKLSDAPLTKCESCSGKLEKQFSRTSFQLKGGGWFGSGYGGATPSSKDKEGAKESSKNDSKEGSKEGAKESSKDKESPGGGASASSTSSSSDGCGSGSCGCAG